MSMGSLSATAALAAALALPGPRAGAADAPEAGVSLDVRDADVQEVTRALLEVSGLQAVFAPGISCRLTLRVHELSWLKALRATLDACGLGYEEEGTVVWIATRERLRSEAAERRRLAELTQATRSSRVARFRLSYARARQVAPLLERLLSSHARVAYDDRTNTLIIVEP